MKNSHVSEGVRRCRLADEAQVPCVWPLLQLDAGMGRSAVAQPGQATVAGVIRTVRYVVSVTLPQLCHGRTASGCGTSRFLARHATIAA